jgi:hypothetical protein
MFENLNIIHFLPFRSIQICNIRWSKIANGIKIINNQEWSAVNQILANGANKCL